MAYEGWTETRAFSVLGQMTRLTVGGGSVADWEYTFPASGNNGRITKMKDYVTGEEVNYQYDSLNRLLSAATTPGAGTQWGLSFTYDGFGNKLGQTATAGSPPTPNVTVDPQTNRQNGFTYDNNGNQLVTASTLYDVFNRMKTADGSTHYAYASDNKRVLKMVGGTVELTHYGITGQRMSTYALQTCGVGTCVVEQTRNVWFGGKLIRTGPVGSQASVVTDRLGSVRVRKVGSAVERLDYYPYGEEKPGATAQGREKFATYLRDGTLDYSDQRHYMWQYGRFTAADPAEAVDIEDPGSFNLYAYVGGDPVGFFDPSGLVKCRDLVETFGGTRERLGDVVAPNGSIDLYTGVVWAEAGGPPSDQLAVALVVNNRWLVVNELAVIRRINPNMVGGYEYINGRGTGWGNPGPIENILTAPGQFATVRNGALLPVYQQGIMMSLDSEDNTPQCRRLRTAASATMNVLENRINHEREAPFGFEGHVTSFNLSDQQSRPFEQRMGRLGSPPGSPGPAPNNIYYGVRIGNWFNIKGPDPINRTIRRSARAQDFWAPAGDGGGFGGMRSYGDE